MFRNPKLIRRLLPVITGVFCICLLVVLYICLPADRSARIFRILPIQQSGIVGERAELLHGSLLYAPSPLNAFPRTEELFYRIGLSVIFLVALLLGGGLYIRHLLREREWMRRKICQLQEINQCISQLYPGKDRIRHYQSLQIVEAFSGQIARELIDQLRPVLEEEQGRDKTPTEVLEAGKRAIERADQLLLFSQYYATKPQRVTIRLDVILWDVLRCIRDVLPPGVLFRDQTCDTGVHIDGNPAQMQAAFLYLCTIAYRYLENCGGILSITNSWVVSGQLPEDLRRQAGAISYAKIVLYAEKFDLGDRETYISSENYSMAAVNEVLGQHQGYLVSDDQDKRSMMFAVYLPAIDIPFKVVKPKPEDTESGYPANLLLLDHRDRVIKAMRKRLRSKGYRVDGFTDFGEAERAFGQTPAKWNLMIVDSKSAAEKGAALLEKAKDLRPGLPVLLIADTVQQEVLQLRKRNILDEILLEPLDYNDLLQVVRRLSCSGLE